MTVNDCITYIDGIEPNAYTNEQKAKWVQECEGRVFTQVFLQQPVNGVDQGLATVLARELSLPAPYDRIYPSYLHAMIHYANGEYDRYSSSMQLYNDAWAELNRWFGRDFDISDRNRNRRVTVRIQPWDTEQTLLTIPQHCAYVAVRVVVQQAFMIAGGTVGITGEIWAGDPDNVVGHVTMDTYSINSIKVLVGDIGGTTIGIKLSTDANAGDAYITGILCQPDEEFFWRSEQRYAEYTPPTPPSPEPPEPVDPSRDMLRYINKPVSAGENSVILSIASGSITEEHVLARIEFANPSYIKAGYSWNVEDGRFNLYGTATNATTANVLLVSPGENTLRFVEREVSIGSSAPILTISDSAITSEFVLERIEFANPYRIQSGYSWSVEDGQFSLTGTATNTTKASVLLVRQNTETLRFADQPVSEGNNETILEIEDASITAKHVLARIEFADPSYIEAGYSWNVEDGRFSLQGTSSGVTSANVLLVLRDN